MESLPDELIVIILSFFKERTSEVCKRWRMIQSGLRRALQDRARGIALLLTALLKNGDISTIELGIRFDSGFQITQKDGKYELVTAVPVTKTLFRKFISRPRHMSIFKQIQTILKRTVIEGLITRPFSGDIFKNRTLVDLIEKTFDQTTRTKLDIIFPRREGSKLDSIITSHCSNTKKPALCVHAWCYYDTRLVFFLESALDDENFIEYCSELVDNMRG